MQMHDCQNEDLHLVDSEEDPMWKTLHQAPPRLLVHHRKLKWILFYSFQEIVQVVQERNSQSGTLGFIP